MCPSSSHWPRSCPAASLARSHALPGGGSLREVWGTPGEGLWLQGGPWGWEGLKTLRRGGLCRLVSLADGLRPLSAGSRERAGPQGRRGRWVSHPGAFPPPGVPAHIWPGDTMMCSPLRPSSLFRSARHCAAAFCCHPSPRTSGTQPTGSGLRPPTLRRPHSLGEHSGPVDAPHRTHVLWLAHCRPA